MSSSYGNFQCFISSILFILLLFFCAKYIEFDLAFSLSGIEVV